MNRAERYIRRQAKSGDHEALAIVGLWDDHKPIKKGKLAPGRSRKERKTERNERMQEVRRNVVARAIIAGNKCECGCGRDIRYDLIEVDHFFGGSSRLASTTVEGCWAITKQCHLDKTANEPSRAAWLARFGDHCTRYGYMEQLKKVDAALALDAGKHPQRSSGTR